jgi:two-component sensor histidine kinase
VAQATIEQRLAPIAHLNRTTAEDLQRSDPLDRLAALSARIRPYSANAIIIGMICLGGATALRLIGSWTNSDFLFATYLPSILAAGLLAGIPAAIGVTLSSAIMARLFFVPSYLHYAPQQYGEFNDFFMYLVSATLTICFAHYCRVVLDRLHKRNLANEILVRELQHRNKNACAVIDVILRKSLADDPERASKVFGRIKAMMSANELLTASQPPSITLKQLFVQAIAPYGVDRLDAFGPEIAIGAERARHLILLVHELVTNAAKHGALSRLNGRVFVHWREKSERIDLNWKEREAPELFAQKRKASAVN